MANKRGRKSSSARGNSDTTTWMEPCWLCKRLGLSINRIGYTPLPAIVGSGPVPHTHVARHAALTLVLVTRYTVCGLLCTCDPGYCVIVCV